MTTLAWEWWLSQDFAPDKRILVLESTDELSPPPATDGIFVNRQQRRASLRHRAHQHITSKEVCET